MENQSVTEILEHVKTKICDTYCKYPEQCEAEHKDYDEAYNVLLEKYCEGCPLNLL